MLMQGLLKPKRILTWLTSFLRPETPLYGVGWAVAAVIIVLLIIALWSSLRVGFPTLRDPFILSLQNYRDAFASPLMARATRNTLILATGITVVSVAIAIALAWLIHRTSIRFKQFFTTFIFLTTMLPQFIRLISWIMLIDPRIGILNDMIRSIFPWVTGAGPLSPYNMPFMIFVASLALSPIVFLMLGPAFMSLDPALEESAEASGMSKLQVLRRITLPLLWPSIVGGAIYIFMIGIATYEIPALLGLPARMFFFSTVMFDAVHPPSGYPAYGVAGVYAVMMLIPTVIALYYYQKTMRLSHRYTTVTGKGYKPKLTSLGRWSWAGYAFIGLYLLLDFIVPILGLVWVSILPTIQKVSWAALSKLTLANYPEAYRWIVDSGALSNTIILLIAVGVGGMLIGLTISWVAVRTRMRGRYALDTIAMIPHAVPGLAIAFSVMILQFLLLHIIPLYQSLLAIILADIVALIPFNTRTLNATLVQIHPELEEAVQTSGGSKLTALRKVVIPLIAPSLMYTFIWSTLSAFKEVVNALFLISPHNIVLSTLIWTRWQSSADYGVASATSIITMGVMGIFIALVMRFFPGVRKAMLKH